MRALLGPEADEFLAALSVRTVGLRVNGLRLTPEDFEHISPFGLEPLPFPPGGYLVTGEGSGRHHVRGESGMIAATSPPNRPGKHPFHAAGLYYLQDPGAMVVGALLDPRAGERVLDLSAAPGGKATHLASLLGGEGVLVANDVSPARARELAGNLERMGVRNAIVTNETPARMADWFGGWFDRVLVDAPCSGESMFCKSDVARREWSLSVVAGCARRQADLLETAARLVRPGGLLLYSTCTFSPEENEGAVRAFLNSQESFEVVPLGDVPGARQGRGDWLPGGAETPGLDRTMRLWPHLVPGSGHYLAGLRRAEGAERSPVPGPSRPAAAPQARALFDRFREDHLIGDPVGDRMHGEGSELYALPDGSPEMGSLRVLRPGWWLGTLRKNRFEPAHALALGLGADDVAHPVVLEADDPATRAYLRGETLTSDGPQGWTLVTVEGFALGWGKRVGSTVKNHLPKGLRWG